MTRSLRYLTGLTAVVVALIFVAMPYVDALALITRAAGIQGALGSIGHWRAHGVVTEGLIKIATRHGEVDGRIYRPMTGTFRRSVALVPGVHIDGIRESRLVGLAEDLAGAGYQVLTVAPPNLQRFMITPENIDIIEDAARWLALEHPGPDGKIGMLGISFSGGLSIVAAGRPDLRDKVAFVMSFGGHGDLARVLRYLCSGNAPAMPPVDEAKKLVAGAEHVSIAPPHDYGVAVTLLSLAEFVVPPDQVEPLRKGILTFLTASSLDGPDKARAKVEFENARGFEKTLPEPARTLMEHVNNRAVDKLSPVLLPIVEKVWERPELAAMSPERMPAPRGAVFLLHGAEDSVIPSVETVLLANHLRDKTELHAVLSGLITHAEVDKSAAAIEVWRLIGFWKDLMSE